MQLESHFHYGLTILSFLPVTQGQLDPGWPWGGHGDRGSLHAPPESLAPGRPHHLLQKVCGRLESHWGLAGWEGDLEAGWGGAEARLVKG